MRKISTLHYLWILFVMNTKAAFALRGAFMAASTFMLLNNLIFFVFWIIVFSRVDAIGGWRLKECALLFGLVAIAYGTIAVFAGGITRLARFISEGELDICLTQPKPPLFTAIGSTSNVSGWGDIVSGIVLIVCSGYWHPQNLLLLLIGAICSGTIFLMSGVILHSAAFWLGPTLPVSRQLYEFLLTFSLYPGPIYTGWLRIAMFTIAPAGFIGILPVEIMRAPSAVAIALLLAATVGYSALALWTFACGLKRYESGNRISVRA